MRTCAYQGVKNVRFFRKIWRAFFFWNTRFEIRPFALLPTNCSCISLLYLCYTNEDFRPTNKKTHTKQLAQEPYLLKQS